MITIDEKALHLSHLELMERYFAKLFGQLIFLKVKKLKRDDDFSYRYYIEDTEGWEGVMEIKWDVYINILEMLRTYNEKYYKKFIEELENNG